MKLRAFNQDELLHVVDSHHGVYSYQIFSERFIDNLKTDINIVSYQSLINGNPHEDEYYFDIWSDGMANEEFVIDGKIYSVIENEGIYLIPTDMEIDDDWII